MDFVKVAQEGQCVINMNNVLDDTVNAQRYVRIYLVYKFGDSLGKEYSSMIWILKLKEVGSK